MCWVMQELPGFVNSFRVYSKENIKDFEHNSDKIGCEFFQRTTLAASWMREDELWLLQWHRGRKAGWHWGAGRGV